MAEYKQNVPTKMEQDYKIKFREDLKQSMKTFVLDLIKLCKTLPFDDDSRIIKKQVLRSGSSVYSTFQYFQFIQHFSSLSN